MGTFAMFVRAISGSMSSGLGSSYSLPSGYAPTTSRSSDASTRQKKKITADYKKNGLPKPQTPTFKGTQLA
jgi:hypothetical protein